MKKSEDLLVESGLWTSLRTRPFSKNPLPESRPKSSFCHCNGYKPTFREPVSVINTHKEDFKNGVKILSKLTEGKTYVCHGEGETLLLKLLGQSSSILFKDLTLQEMWGHIYILDPAHADRHVWHIGYQDVISVGNFLRLKLWTERIIALGGPQARNPRLLRARLGADLGDLLRSEFEGDDVRVVSGSVQRPPC